MDTQLAETRTKTQGGSHVVFDFDRCFDHGTDPGHGVAQTKVAREGDRHGKSGGSYR